MQRYPSWIRPHLPQFLITHEDECLRIARFLLVGGSSFAVNALLYIFFSRLVFASAPAELSNVVSVVLSSLYNYTMHRAWTFQSRGSHRKQGFTYLLVALSAMAVQATLFWIGYRVLHVYDIITVVVVNLLIPLYTYPLHKHLTFRRDGAHATLRNV